MDRSVIIDDDRERNVNPDHDEVDLPDPTSFGRKYSNGMFGTKDSRDITEKSPHTLGFLGAFCEGGGNQMSRS